MTLDLQTVKQHLHINEDFTDEDEYLCNLISVAEAAIENHIQICLAELAQIYGGDLPAPIIHAALLFIGTLYMNRESVSFAAPHIIPHAYEYLLQPYVKYYH